MKDFLSSAKEAVLYHWLAIVYGILFSVNSLATAITASFLNTEWNTLSQTSKFLLVVVIVSNWTGTMLAFLNKTISRVQDGKNPIETGDTETIKKP